MNLYNIIVSVLFLIIITPVVCTFLSIGPLHFMIVNGASMEPTITENDIIVVKETDMDQLEVGDIISYSQKFEHFEKPVVVTHRLIGIADAGLKTKGDAYDEPDLYFVLQEDVIGKFIFKIPFAGALVHFAGTGAGLFSLIIIPALILIFQEIYNIIGYRRV